MRDLAEYVAGSIDRLRHTSPELGILRVALLVTTGLMIVLVRSWTGEDVAGVLVWVAGTLALLMFLRPDSAAPSAFLAVTGVWWLGAGSRAEPWQHITVVVLVGAIHILAAQAGAVPSHASLTPSASFTLLVGSGAYVVVVGLAAVLLLAATSAGSALSSLGLVIVAVVLLAVAVVGGVLVASRS